MKSVISQGNELKISQTHKKTGKQLQEKTGKIERSASGALEKVVNFAGNNQNTPANKIKSELQNAVDGFDVATVKEKTGLIENVLEDIDVSSGISGSILNKTFADLAPKLNTDLKCIKTAVKMLVVLNQNCKDCKAAANQSETAIVVLLKAYSIYLVQRRILLIIYWACS